MFERPPPPTHGEWNYHRLATGGLIQAAPEACPRGHHLGPGCASIGPDTVSCHTCYAQDPDSAEFAPAEPGWMRQFNTLVSAGRRREAMDVIDRALPVPGISGTW